MNKGRALEDKKEYTDWAQDHKKWEGNELCCMECGIKYGEPSDSVVTANRGECCVCHEITTVTSIRHYNYLQKLH